MGKRKTSEQIADEQRRYTTARSAQTAEEFELLALDPNQAIRAVAASNPNADEVALARFARDRFWGVGIEVAHHPNVTVQILLDMLEPDPRKRGVVHNAARRRLEAEGIQLEENDQSP